MFDIPPVYKKLREKFEKHKNVGLTLRWEAAICESELVVSYSEREVTHAIFAWNKKITDLISKSKYLKLMIDQDKTNRSIISFMVEKDGKLLDTNELKRVYDELLLNSTSYQTRFKSMSIGQPVSYERHAFIRFALGSRNVRSLIESSHDYSQDELLVDVLEQIISKLEF